MKYLDMTARPPPELAPEAFRVLADSDPVSEARAVALNVTGREQATVLVLVDGDRAAVLERLDDAPEVESADVAPAPSGGFYVLLGLHPEAAGVLAVVFETLATAGLVALPPLRYRDGAAQARLVGEPDAVGAVVETLPDAVDVTVRAVGERGLAVESAAAALSDRQREALLAALELGYYDQPRGATHGDVADRLGCAASTASEHLRKAEATLVRTVLDRDGRGEQFRAGSRHG